MRFFSIWPSVAAVAALIPLIAAVSDTAPFLAFTSRQSILLNRGLVSRNLASATVAPLDIARSLTSKGKDLCVLDGMMIVEVENLDSNAFQALPVDSFLRSRALDAPSQLAFPHVSLNRGSVGIELRTAAQKACRKAWRGKDNIKTIHLASLDDEALESSVSSFSQEFPDHLVVVTSATRRLQLRKRATKGSNNTDTVMDPKLGLLHRYQFFSTGLLIALLVVVLLLLPAVYFAVGLLSSIETPDRMGERARSTGEKKGQ